jgi:hypothetical protein
MSRSSGAKRLVALFVAAAVLIQSAACGTLLHPERRGQPAGRLDAGIVVLDAIGLIFFFIPGVIAFAVDFSNGTIYLPPQAADARPASGGQDLRTVRLSPAELTPQRLEAVVQEHTGRAVRLEPGAYRAARLNRPDEFSAATLEGLQSSTTPAEVVFGGGSD